MSSLGLVLTQIWVVCASKVIYIIPNNPSNTSCPSQPCATLSHLLDNNGTLPVVSNVEYHLLAGEHHVPPSMELYGLYNLTFIGITDKFSSPVVLISCLQSFIHVISSTYVVIRNIVFQQCDLIQYDQYYDHETNLMLTECWSCEVRNVTFFQYGLVVHNLLGNSWLCNIIIDLTIKRSYTYLHFHGIILTTKNLSDISYNHHSIIVLDKICIYSQDDNLLLDTSYDESVPECISMWLWQTTYDVTIIVNNSHFHDINRKVFLILSDSVATYNNVIIDNCLFENIAQRHFMITFTFVGFNKILTISNCTFKNNKIFHYLISIMETDDTHSLIYNTSYTSPNIINIKACTALNNNCGFLYIFNFLEYVLKVFILGPTEITDSGIPKSDITVLNFVKVNVLIMGPVTISNISVLTIISFITSDVTFVDDITIHSCICDQVIYLQSDSGYMVLEQNSSIIIYNNSIQKETIDVENDLYSAPYPYCIFQFIASNNISNNTTSMDYKIIFNNNHTNNDTDNKCKATFYHYTSHCRWIDTSTFHGYDPTIINKQIIVHHNYNNQMNKHNIVCYCSNNVTDCSLDVLGQVYPGQTLQVELCLPCSGKDATLHVETHHRVLPLSSCKISHQNQLINFLATYNNILNFTIASNATEICELFLTVSPYLYQIYEAFYVKLLPCPIGFVLQNGICDCDPVLSSNQFVPIKACNIDQLTIKRPQNIWIAPLTSNNCTYLVCSNCPMDYCLQHSSDLNLQNPDLQCHSNRTGILCSQCQHSLSMVFGSSRCTKCTNIHILISVVILFAGITIVVILYLLNLTVTNGTVMGIIFYANIISINDSTFLANDNIFKPLRVFISFVNLDLGVETCFYNGLDSYDKMFLQLCFPLYVIAIVIVIIAISNYSSRVLRWTYAKSFSVLATLLLLSYSGVLRTVSTVLFFYSTIIQLPSGHQSLVWSVDASVQFKV